MNNYGFTATDILIPQNCNMSKWSCVACDQYTGEPEYWKSVENFVGDEISTLKIMLPEIYLSETKARSELITENMINYLKSDVFNVHKDCMIYVKRTLKNGKIRRGLVGAIDLEVYDFSKGTISLCRPTEATVVERLPARVEIRKNAKIEMPHIMMLLDDKSKVVIEQFDNLTDKLEKVYDFDLMMDSGHITGYKIEMDDTAIVYRAIEELYNKSTDEHPMLYAMGDGNHSLAAAKLYYEQIKDELGEQAKQNPSRYALVELVNLHDDSLEFEPIHRVFFDVDTDKFISDFSKYCGLKQGVHDGQQFKLVINGKKYDYTFCNPSTSLTIGTIQNFLDEYAKNNGGETDYIHGDDVVIKLCNTNDRIGFIVDGISKDAFFDVIKKDGILPRKTFSMGHACDKRFYLECRQINE